MVKRNVVFNQDDTNSHNDTAIIHGKVLSEGEKEKVIQHPQNNTQNVVQPKNEEPDNQKLQDDDLEPHKGSKFPTRSHYLNLKTKLNQIPSLKNPTSRLLRITAMVNVPDMKEDTTRP